MKITLRFTRGRSVESLQVTRREGGVITTLLFPAWQRPVARPCIFDVLPREQERKAEDREWPWADYVQQWTEREWGVACLLAGERVDDRVDEMDEEPVYMD